MPTITYKEAGVDTVKASEIITSFSRFLKSRPQDPNVLSGIGPFASCYSLGGALKGKQDPVLVTCCDGVGTKVKLALEWGDLSGLGSDLVAMNVNDLLCAGARPLLFLDYYATAKLEPSQLMTLLRSIQRGCEVAGCALVGGETAEMPGLYQNDDFDLAGFAVGITSKEELLGPNRVRVGDVLVGIESSGFHSNGFSLLRRLVEKEKLSPNSGPSFDTRSWKELLLKPTHIYVKALTPVMHNIHAAAHLTGGGLFENLPRVLPDGLCAVVDSSRWEIPPLFLWAQQMASLSTTELLSTFNCGLGMIAIVSRSDIPALKRSIENEGMRCSEIGAIKKAKPSGAKILWQ